VLVTGGSGFIGLPAVKALVERDFEVHGVARHRPDEPAGVTWHVADLLAGDAADEIVRRLRPTHILHLGWNAVPGEFWSTLENVSWLSASATLLRAFAEQGGERAVLAGTCAEYDWHHDKLGEYRTPLRPTTLYGACKRSLGQVSEALGETLQLSVAWGRIFFLYGPREHPKRLIPSAIRSAMTGQALEMTDGRQVRDFLHVDDVARAFVELLDSAVTGDVNIASGQGVQLRDVIEKIERILGVRGIVRLGGRSAPVWEPDVLVADVERLRAEVGFTPAYDLESGLADTIAWWRGRAAD
jgi:nucleoside-diphosphate-sugar epimerase